MEDKRFITRLAAGLIFPSVLQILQAAAQRSYETAWAAFQIFLALHPVSIRTYVKNQLREKKSEIEKLAEEEIEEIYGAKLDDLLEDERSGLLTGVRRTWHEIRCKYMLIIGMEALAEAWERHGLVWFSGIMVIKP